MRNKTIKETRISSSNLKPKSKLTLWGSRSTNPNLLRWTRTTITELKLCNSSPRPKPLWMSRAHKTKCHSWITGPSKCSSNINKCKTSCHSNSLKVSIEEITRIPNSKHFSSSSCKDICKMCLASKATWRTCHSWTHNWCKICWIRATWCSLSTRPICQTWIQTICSRTWISGIYKTCLIWPILWICHLELIAPMDLWTLETLEAL